MSILKFKQLFEAETCTYTYLLHDSQTMEGVIIDPVKEMVERDLKLIEELGIVLKYNLETHVHADHITGAHILREKTGAKVVYGAAAAVSCADIAVRNGDTLSIGEFKVQVISTPGHTDGCSSYYIDGKVFTGDAMLIRSCGRTDFQQGSAKNLFHSVTTRLFNLPNETIVYPAHDYNGNTSSTIGEEKSFNKRLANRTEGDFIKLMEGLNLPNPKHIDIAVPANMKCGQI